MNRCPGGPNDITVGSLCVMAAWPMATMGFLHAPERLALNGLGARPVESEKAMLLSVLTLPTISTRWSVPGIHQLGEHLGLQRLQDFIAVRVALSDDLIELVPLQHAHPVQRWVEVHVGGCLRLAVT